MSHTVLCHTITLKTDMDSLLLWYSEVDHILVVKFWKCKGRYLYSGPDFCQWTNSKDPNFPLLWSVACACSVGAAIKLTWRLWLAKESDFVSDYIQSNLRQQRKKFISKSNLFIPYSPMSFIFKWNFSAF